MWQNVDAMSVNPDDTKAALKISKKKCEKWKYLKEKEFRKKLL